MPADISLTVDGASKEEIIDSGPGDDTLTKFLAEMTTTRFFGNGQGDSLGGCTGDDLILGGDGNDTRIGLTATSPTSA